MKMLGEAQHFEVLTATLFRVDRYTWLSDLVNLRENMSGEAVHVPQI